MGSSSELDDVIDSAENQVAHFANKITFEEKILMNNEKESDFDLTLGGQKP